jgi:c-di-GMP-binding flagellar brake protein YcgR
MINRRRHTRISIAGSATLEFTKKGKIQSIQTMIANISLRGIGLYSYSSITVATRVSITTTFISLDGGLKTDSVQGRVISNRKIGDTHFIGIQFDEEINDKNQPALCKYVRNSLPID